MTGSITIGSTNISTTYKVYATDASIYNSPEPDVQTVSVQGLNGDLLIPKDRYKNIRVTYPCVIVSNFQTNIADLRAFLLSQVGYVKIADSFDTDHYRLGRYVGGLEVDPAITGDAGIFTLVFDCKPQRYLVSGDTETTFTRTSAGQTGFGTIVNSTRYDALPLITVTGQGSGNIRIVKQPIETGAGIYVLVSGLDGTIVLDSELQDAYNGSTNMNSYISLTSGSFHKLVPGTNAITVGTGLDVTIKVKPRWWTL